MVKMFLALMLCAMMLVIIPHNTGPPDMSGDTVATIDIMKAAPADVQVNFAQKIGEDTLTFIDDNEIALTIEQKPANTSEHRATLTGRTARNFSVFGEQAVTALAVIDQEMRRDLRRLSVGTTPTTNTKPSSAPTSSFL